MSFPSTFSSFNKPTPSDRLNSPSHSALHNTVSSALGQVETVIGLDGDSSTLGTIIGDLRSPDSTGGGHIQSANKGGTGQTSYTKGDLLVATSTSVLTKFAVGSNDQVLVADSAQSAGIKWGAAPTIIVSSTTAVSSVWTKPGAATATSRVFVELWGGGGSGGSGTATSEAGGGGGGGYASGWFIASLLQASVLINVGRGGDSHTINEGGSTGGNTVFGVNASMLTAYGGGGGGQATTGAGGGGGAGTFEAGQLANGSSPGRGGSQYGGTGVGDGTQNMVLGYETSIVGAVFQGGAGGHGIVGGGIPSVRGLNAIYGGGGGAGISSSITSGSALGGLSTFGGMGGSSSVLTSGSAMAGMIPGGGGGAAYGGGSSGEGGSGKAVITVFL